MKIVCTAVDPWKVVKKKNYVNTKQRTRQVKKRRRKRRKNAKGVQVVSLIIIDDLEKSHEDNDGQDQETKLFKKIQNPDFQVSAYYCFI